MLYELTGGFDGFISGKVAACCNGVMLSLKYELPLKLSGEEGSE